MNNACMLLFVLIVVGVARTCNGRGLVKNFYKMTCPLAEKTVRDITWSRVATNSALGAKLLRVHYHDCFVMGCDASLLLDTVGTVQSEKEAGPNLLLSGFDVIDDIKTQLEKDCPGVVSCADIVALAARDSVSFRKRPLWDVLTGRRDGKVSLASNINGNLPSPFSDFATLQQLFAKKNLNVNDLVALSGAHTIGKAHCGTFSKRLFNFTANGDADPSLDTRYANFLRTKCPNPSDPATTVEMDPRSSLSFDSHYYQALTQKQGLFQSDAALLTNIGSARLARQLQNGNAFMVQFAKSMLKMGAIEVLTGNAGEIRKKCRVVNP
ncbi:hypothetical protein IFM89_035547 [Coptis chinensis]|uniref:Peroxidase n=1 Tax=Coptis chinensis TaxID=261450 RepID=A0A835HYE1_9MAGN|nr:hypothetical protein IFM89_035547 [Coptis chinensis]